MSTINDIFDMAGIGDNEFAGKQVLSPPVLPTEQELEKMQGYDIQKLREQYHGDTKAQTYLTPYAHRAMNRELIKEGSFLENLIKVPALTVATAVYAEGKEKNLLRSDIDTGRDPHKEAVQGLIGIGEGLQAFFSDGKSEIKREVSPEVQRVYDIRNKVEQIMGDLIKTESGGRHTTEEGELITSPTGAKGITQILPSTARKPGYGIKPLQDASEEEYIRFGKEYLTKMIDIFDNTEQGIAAYNAGPGAIHRAISKANRTGRDWKEFLSQEAKEYIQKVKYTPPAESTFHKPRVTDVMGVRG